MEPEPPHDSFAHLLKVWLETLLGMVKNTFNPKHHIVQFKEDWLAFKHALKSNRMQMHEHDISRITDLFRGRFVACMFVSGPFNMIAVVVVQAMQYAIGNPNVALTLPLVSFFMTGIVFQTMWYQVNKGLYQHSYPNPAARLKAFEKDLWPVHVASVQFTLVFWTLNVVVGKLVISFTDLKNTAAAHNIPWVVVLTTFEFILVSGPFVRNMGDFFERYSAILAKRYAWVFDEACNKRNISS